MFKLLVLSCLLVSCLADPFVLPSWLREAGRRHRHPRGCADRAEGWRACARLDAAEALAPHSSDCSLFFYCRAEGARPACRRCPAGLHFNPALQVCDWPANVECHPRPPHPRPPRGNGTTTEPTTPNEDTSVTFTDSSATPEEISTNTPEAPQSSPEAPSSEAPSSEPAPSKAPSSEPASSEPASSQASSSEPAPWSTEPSTYSWRDNWGRGRK